jgi:hypothetical protein
MGGALIPPLGSAGLCLSVASGLDGVTHIVVITDMVARGWMMRGKLSPLLLPVLGSLGPQTIRDVARGVNAASSHRCGVRIKADLSMAAIGWDGLEGAAWRREAELLACYSRVMQRSCLALCSRLLVFRSGMSEMSSRRQAAATMLYAAWGNTEF